MNKKSIIIGAVLILLVVVGIFLFSGKNKDSSMTGNTILESSDLNSNPDKVTIYFFWGDGCPHCAAEKPFLENLGKKYGDKIEIKMFETWKNPKNVELFNEVSQAYDIQVQGVPTTFIGNKNWVGYADYMGKEIEDYVKYCIENRCDNPLNNDVQNCNDDESVCLLK